ncbi:BMC domain-containing protein [Latilactobacillus fuchuensis]|uniref:Propanediol utilization protein PduA n=2 Tax=Latilactobacillus fuchuensis TaxID=164393 RepID=A0A2N9DY28_9LACO|nr:BMC domain-containing protein [Latilactobacillus fuchuensis]MCP8857420.1 BMC domain-containing protein [Latilactobacillus fuchuensis]SPC39780.1 Propanediol utilization protein PduA [Latilactobacillus fuchuensis]
MNALGLVEVVGFSTAVYVADAMVKTADITITRLERTKGAGWMTIYVNGDVGAVRAAISAGQEAAEKDDKFVTAEIIARPTEELSRLVKPTKTAPVAKETVKINTEVKNKNNKTKK